MRYFLKELASNKLYLRCSGAVVKWDFVVDDTGYLATEKQPIIDELDTAVKGNVGGVVVIDEMTYEEAKKKAPVMQLPSNLPRDRPSISQLTIPSAPGVAAVNPVPLHGQLPDVPAVQADPIKVQTEFVRPKTRKGLMKERPDADK